ENPLKQEHSKFPSVLVQAAFAWQLCVPNVHSSISVHDTPSPVNPVLQAHVKLPIVFVQFAFA
uniref:Uncharacterized protein n=1 Tax=Ciona intestinalis TaxID=7719 RepID=F7A5H9_CIOIN